MRLHCFKTVTLTFILVPGTLGIFCIDTCHVMTWYCTFYFARELSPSKKMHEVKAIHTLSFYTDSVV